MALSATPDFWWKLDETSGTTADNSGGFGTPSDYDFAFTISGGTPTLSWLGGSESWGGGGITGGVELVRGGAGSWYYGESSTNLPFQNQTKITIACWTYHTASDQGDGRIFFQGDTFLESGHQVMVGEVSTDDARARIRTDSNGGATFIEPNIHPTDQTKVHTVWVLDLTLGSGELKLYVNGTLTETFNVTGTDIADDTVFSAAGGLRTLLGASTHNGLTSTGTDNPWEGAICDLRIWLDAATAAEVADIYDNSLGGGVGGVEGALAATETGADVLAVDGVITVQGNLAATGTGADNMSASGVVIAAGDLAANETGADTAAASGTVEVTGALAATETGSDTLAVSGTVAISGDLGATETGADALASSGDVAVTGDLTATESGADVFASTGTVEGAGVVGALAAVEVGADDFAGAGTVEVQGALAATETGPDAAAIDAAVAVQGDLAAAEAGADVFAGSGGQLATGTMAAVESGADVFAGAGGVLVRGGLLVAESDPDVLAAAGSILVSGALVATEAGADELAAAGGVVVTGALAATETGADVFEAIETPPVIFYPALSLHRETRLRMNRETRLRMNR